MICLPQDNICRNDLSAAANIFAVMICLPQDNICRNDLSAAANIFAVTIILKIEFKF